jgi:alanyl-tRNA synthetase
VGDKGDLLGEATKFFVEDTTKPFEDLIVHAGTVKKGSLKVGDSVLARVDETSRGDIARHHTATHLLHATLRYVLGDHVKQAGSLVAPDRFRFDFTHYTALTEREIGRIEELINEYIIENRPVETQVLDVDQAVASGAMALFDEKYGDKVRVVSVKDVSKELCGGTHTKASGDIGSFKILSEVGIAAGVRRIEGVAGRQAYRAFKREEQSLRDIAQTLKTTDLDVAPRVEKLVAQIRGLEKELDQFKHKLHTSRAGDAAGDARDIQGVKVLAKRTDGMDAKDLRTFGDKLKDKLGSGILALGSVKDDKVSLIVMVSKDLTDRFSAGAIIKEMAPILGGTGGGKADLAQSGGKDPAKLDAALEALYAIISKK